MNIHKLPSWKHIVLIVTSFVCWTGITIGTSIRSSLAQSAVMPSSLGSISGVLTDETGELASGVTVIAALKGDESYVDTDYITVRTTTTSTDGHYRLAGLPTDSYYILAKDSQNRWAQSWYSGTTTIEQAQPVVVVGDNREAIDFSLAAGGRITGTITITEDIVVADAAVTIYTLVNFQWERVVVVKADTNGRYDSGVLPVGIYRVCATSTLFPLTTNCLGGREPATARDVVLNKGELSRDQSVILAEGRFDGVITGKVKADGNPYPGMQVTLIKYTGGLSAPTVQTNSNGIFRFEGLNDWIYLLTYNDPKGEWAMPLGDAQQPYASLPVINLQNGQTIVIDDMALVRAGAIQGRVSRSNGIGIPGAKIEVRINPYDFYDFVLYGKETYTDASGNYRVEGIAPGNYYVSASYCQLPECFAMKFYGATEAWVAGGATLVQVSEDNIVSKIDITLGPDNAIFLPMIQAE